MRRTAQFLVVLIALVAVPVDLIACGDKYLSVGRGARFQRGYVSLHPVSVAVLRSKATGQRTFLSRLKIAGHRLTVTDDASKLQTMLASGKFDVVLADFENAAEIDRMLSVLPVKPLFLPVVDAGSMGSRETEKKYGCLLNSAAGKKQKNFLAVLDDAVDAQSKAKPVVCDMTDM